MFCEWTLTKIYTYVLWWIQVRQRIVVRPKRKDTVANSNSYLSNSQHFKAGKILSLQPGMPSWIVTRLNLNECFIYLDPRCV